MLNGIWMAMIVLAFVGAVCTGRWTALSAAAADGARQVETVLLLLGAMCLWTGIMRIAGEAGLTNGLSKILSPVIKRLFPNYGKNETVREKISMNIAANMLGMGNAATPFGLSAMDEMQKLQTGDAPTQEMILFVVMNTASFQLIPSAAVTLRASYGSADPYDVLPHIWLVSFGGIGAAAVCGVIALTVMCGYVKGLPVFELFTKGAAEGMHTAIKLLPTLLGLIVGISMLRASGFLELFSALLRPVTEVLNIPTELMPLILLRPLSGSGSVSYVTELYGAYGADSVISRLAAILSSSTETTFYAAAVYFSGRGYKTLRYTIPAALCGDLAAVLLTLLSVRLFG